MDRITKKKINALEHKTNRSIAYHKEVKEVLLDRVVRDAKTEIGHSLKRTPTEIIIMPHTNATVWRVQKSNDHVIYLQASADVVCDIVVKA